MILKVRNSGGGIGDQVCGLYVCQALKEKYPEATIEYYSKFPEWLIDVEHIVPKPYSHYFISPPAKVDLYVDSSTTFYSTKKFQSRKQIYTDQIGFGKLNPAPPQLKRTYKFQRSYISLFPFAAWKNREWPLNKWIELEQMLINSGYETLIVGQANRKDEMGKFAGRKLIGAAVNEVIDTLLNSEMVVANDSGMAHVSGMYGIPTICVLSGQFDTNHLFSETRVLGIIPSHFRCSGCMFDKYKNKESRCKDECRSLASVEPLQVYNKIENIISYNIGMSGLFGTITLI